MHDVLTRVIYDEERRKMKQCIEKMLRVELKLIEEASRPRQNLLLPYPLSASFWDSDPIEKRPIPELRTSTGSAVFGPGTVGFASRSTSRTLLMPTEPPHHTDLREKRSIPELRTSTGSADFGPGTVGFASRSTSRTLLMPTEPPHHTDLREKRPIPELRTSTGSAVFGPGTVGFASRSTSRTLLMPKEPPHHTAPVEPNEAGYFKAESDSRTSTQQKMCFERLDVKKTGTSKTYTLSEKEIKNKSFERDKHGNQNISAESKKVDLFQPGHSVLLNLMKILFTTIYLMSFLAQVDCQICQDTLKSVPRCPLNPEEYNMESKKCSNACPSEDDQPSMYEYHCLRNTNKTELIEVCAISQYLFDYCPEYDPVGKVIQMDLSTNCSSNSTQSYYSSSDIFHCDVKCFRLYEKQDVVNATRIPVTNATKTPDDGEVNITGLINTAEQLLVIILVVTSIIVMCITVAYLVFRTIRRVKKRKTEREEEKTKFECTKY